MPTGDCDLGAGAARSEPFMRQVFIGRGNNLAADPPAFERKLFVIRRLAEKGIDCGLLKPTPENIGQVLLRAGIKN